MKTTTSTSNNNNITVVKHCCNNDDIDDIHYGRKLKIYSSNSSSTCRTLQRKLELKVERAKRNYTHLYEGKVSVVEFDAIILYII